MKIITANNLFFTYENSENTIIDDMSFSIEKGSFVSILGHNGSGKSTLVKLFNAILSPTSGTLIVNGYDVSDQTKLTDLRRSVGMVFQNPDNQIVSSVVEEDVAFALENLGVDYDEMHRKVQTVLSTVGMLEFAKHSTTKLSGGQKQRIAIAGVLAMNPEIIVFDEPTAMLDPIGREDVMNVIKKLNSMGTTVILITHFMEEAAMADRCMVLNRGKIFLDDSPEYVFRNVALLKSIGLDVPANTDLMFSLRKYGFKVPISVFNDDDCVKIISELISSQN